MPVTTDHSARPEDGLPAQLLAVLLDRQSLGVAVIDAGEGIRFWNQWLAAWTGIEAGDAMGQSLAMLFPRLVGGELEREIERALASGTAFAWSQKLDPERLDQVEAAMTRGDRELPLHRLTFTPLKHPGLSGCGLLEIAESPFDPVMRRGSSPAVAGDSDGPPEVALASDTRGIIAVDSHGFVQYANPAVEKLLGWSRGSLDDKPLRALFPDLAVDQGEDDYRKLIAHSQKQHQDGLLEAMTAEGGAVKLDVQVFESTRATGEITLLCRDATRSTGAQEALLRQREILSGIFNQVTDAVLLVDRRGRIESSNPVASEMLAMGHSRHSDAHIEEVLRLVDDNRVPVSPFAQAISREGAVNLADPVFLEVPGRQPVSVVVSATPVRNRSNHITDCVIVMRAVSESRQVSTRLSWHETHDPLTQLANRRQIENEVMRAIDAAHVEGGTHVLLYIDLYNFSVVNDTCGYAAGDELLRQFARLLSQEVGDKDVVGRIGNDEFAVLLWDREVEAAREEAEDILWKIRDFNLPWGERRLKVGASIGAHVIDRHTTSEIEVLVSATASCGAARESGRNRIHFQYQSADIRKRHNISKWTARVGEALEENRFVLYCQPIVPLSEKRGAGDKEHYEVLVRMLDPRGNIVAPGKFIGAAEYSGLIDDVDRWVLEKLITTLQGLEPDERSRRQFSVNLSGYTLSDEGFRDYVVNRFQDSGIDPALIQFEITETAAIRHFDRAIRFIHSLKKLGCAFLLDDFGSGLSSFGYLKQLPVDYLKIDGTFVRNMELNDVDFSMVSTINHLAHVMGIATIAECVENPAQMTLLEQMGVDYAQGYLISVPLPLDSLF